MEQNEKELLEKLVVECNSYAEILRKLNKSNSGASTKLLKEKLNDYGITHHFLSEKERKPGEKLSLEEILVENSNYQSSNLKNRLIKEGLKENKCENPKCGITNWYGEQINFHLHHINGNHHDNRLENLQILCPNCHSLTKNYAGKKLKKEQKYCPDCGRPIGNNSEYCKYCSPKHRPNPSIKVKEENRPSKQELLKLIKTKPFTEIGKMYGVTDNAIRKWCKKYEIPSTKKELKEYILQQEST